MRLAGLRFPILVAAGMLSTFPIAAQQLISAKSGLIHYTEGDVKIGEQPAGPNNGVFQSLANSKELTTGEGRAEMLLGPGQFLRLNENSSVRMVSNKLDATRVDVLSGSVLVEIVAIEKNAPITLLLPDCTIELRKVGLYRIDGAQSRLRVFEGEAVVHNSGQNLTARRSKEVTLGAVLVENSFDTSLGDEFTRWASRRAGYVATANVSGARDIYANGSSWSANDWAFNPWYGMYTYIPSRRMMTSPFGFSYFTPDMAFNGMFWNFLGGGYGYYGLGTGYGYGYPFGYGYGNGYGYYGGSPSYGGGFKGGGGVIGKGNPTRPVPIGGRGDNFPHRGNGGMNSPGSAYNTGQGGMVRGTGGGPMRGGSEGNGGSYRGVAAGGYNAGPSGGASASHAAPSGGGFSGGAGGGHSTGMSGGAASSGSRAK